MMIGLDLSTSLLHLHHVFGMVLLDHYHGLPVELYGESEMV